MTQISHQDQTVATTGALNHVHHSWIYGYNIFAVMKNTCQKQGSSSPHVLLESQEFVANFSIVTVLKIKNPLRTSTKRACVGSINVSHLLSLSYCAHKNLGTCSEAQTSWDHHDNKYNSRQTHRTTYLIGMPATRKEVAIIVAMERDVQDAGVVVEGLLSAIAVVNVLEVRNSHICLKLWNDQKKKKKKILSVFSLTDV